MTNKLKMALLTGASSGVGVEFAKQLAARGYDLALTARRMDRLETIRDEITAQHQNRIELIQCDLSQASGAEELISNTAELDIEFLVNNAGLGTYRPGVEHTVAEIDNMIQVNCRALTVLTRHFAEKMLAAGRGRILNHASIAGIHPSPWYSVYSGTKAFVVEFSTTMNYELKDSDVTITTLCPGFFRSEFQDKSGRKPGAFGKKFILDAGYIAKVGLEAAHRGRAMAIPGLQYKVLNFLSRILPRSLTMRAADWFVHR